MMEPQLIDDPWRELNRERQRHRCSIEYLKRILQRINVRDSTGATARQFCRLCVEIPCGGNPHVWRQECPGHGARDYVQAEEARLNQPLRKPKARRADSASETNVA